MSYKFPQDPAFDPLIVRKKGEKDIKECWAHDPSLFQDDDGTYYAFSTIPDQTFFRSHPLDLSGNGVRSQRLGRNVCRTQGVRLFFGVAARL